MGESSTSTIVSVRLQASERARLDHLARARGVSRSDVVRDLLGVAELVLAAQRVPGGQNEKSGGGS